MKTWADFPELSVDFMNDDHRHCLTLLNALDQQLAGNTTTEQQTLNKSLSELKQHLQQHFAREEDAMQRCDFPPFYVHQTEHQALLQELDQVVADWLAHHDKQRLQRYLNYNLYNWLETHALTMDAATANFLTQQGCS